MNKHLRNLIGHQRQLKGFNFGELAKLCGLNPKKWANKICNFEREGILDSDEMVHKLIRVMEIDPEEVKDAVRKDYEDWESWANQPVQMQLILKIIPAVYKLIKIPDHINDPDEAIEFASGIAMEWGRLVCLSINRKESIWFREDGTIKFKSLSEPGISNIPYSSVGGKSFYFG
jgi:hypothetical protein